MKSMPQRVDCIWVILTIGFGLALCTNWSPFCKDGKCRNQQKSRKEVLPQCKSKQPYGKIDLRESKNPSVFRDLTSKEIDGLLRFLYSRKDLNLTRANESKIDTNYIYLATLHLPPKTEVLKYFANKIRQPKREAHVIIFRGAPAKRDVIELIVGPLPYPTGYRHIPYLPESLSFANRPPTFAEGPSYSEVKKEVDKVLGNMLYELYGGRLVNCSNKCLALDFGSNLQPALSGENKRKTFVWLHHHVEYYLLRPLDFVVLIELDEVNEIYIRQIYFDGYTFDSLENVLSYYQRNKGSIQKVPYPTKTSQSPLTLNARGTPQFRKPLRNPTQVSPDGKRYNIIDRRVEYADWDFEIGMHVLTGARLHNIRYKKERIAYEMSIQDLANFYSGPRPYEYTLNYLDAWFSIGTGAKFLMQGVDCPHDATFLNSLFKIEYSDEPHKNEHAYCVFEWNTGMPLRRHSGYYRFSHSFYEGVPSIALVVRTIPTIGMYDYITDFIFYQNGVIETKITPTGVVASTWFSKNNPYSFQLFNNFMSPMHQHLFNIKLDLDIKGTRNRFETLDIESDYVENAVNKNPNAYMIQDRFVKRLKRTELEAAYKFNFEIPSYLTFVNALTRKKFGNSPGYRLINNGMTKFLRPIDFGNGPGISWADYQVAVTKYKDSEPRSTSKYAISNDSDVIFQRFIDDNECIVDQDLVAWVTMGFFHIPHAEDIPVTHTPGLSLSTFLVPFQYFDQSPGMSAANAIRVDPKDKKGKTVGVNIRRFGVESEIDCIPKKNPIEELLKKNPCIAISCL